MRWFFSFVSLRRLKLWNFLHAENPLKINQNITFVPFSFYVKERENEGKNREHPHGMINIQQWRIPFMLRMKSLVHMYADYDVRHRQKVRFKCAVFSDEWNWILFCGTHCDMLWVFMWIDLWEINSKELSLPLQAVS